MVKLAAVRLAGVQGEDEEDAVDHPGDADGVHGVGHPLALAEVLGGRRKRVQRIFSAQKTATKLARAAVKKETCIDFQFWTFRALFTTEPKFNRAKNGLKSAPKIFYFTSTELPMERERPRR